MVPKTSSSSSIWPFRRPWFLYVSTIIFAVFYVIIFIDEAFPLPVIDFDQVCVILLFLFFVVGFVFSWFREKTAGYIFVIWYILEVFVGNFIWDDAAMVLILGFPLLPVGIFYLVYANRKNRDPRPAVHEQWKLFLNVSILSAVVIHFILMLWNLTSIVPERWISGPYMYLIMLFIVFLIAAAISRRNELIAGLLMVAYYIVIIYLIDVSIIDDIGPYGLVNFPVLILGILYLVYWIYIRPRKAVVNG